MCEPDSPTFRCNTPTSLKLNQFEFGITYPNKSEMITLNGMKLKNFFFIFIKFIFYYLRIR